MHFPQLHHIAPVSANTSPDLLPPSGLSETPGAAPRPVHPLGSMHPPQPCAFPRLCASPQPHATPQPHAHTPLPRHCLQSGSQAGGAGVFFTKGARVGNCSSNVTTQVTRHAAQGLACLAQCQGVQRGVQDAGAFPGCRSHTGTILRVLSRRRCPCTPSPGCASRGRPAPRRNSPSGELRVNSIPFKRLFS